MKKSLSLLPLLLITISCSQNLPKEVSDQKFQLQAENKGFQLGEYNSWEYVYTGSIHNKSGSTYGNATLFLSLVFELENGTSITDQQMHEEEPFGFFSGMLAVESIGLLQDGKKIKMDKMVSASIDKQYRQYPIKAVYSEFKLKLLDEINNRETETVIKRENITKAWTSFLSKAK